MSRNIYVVGYGASYANWMQGELVPEMEDADLVVFTGGEDISPALYGKQANRSTWFSSRRDTFEVAEFEKARKLDKKLIGICRGAQLFCALAGGILVQDQRHPFIHPMLTKDGREVLTSSMHHQRMYPWGGKKPRFVLLAWAPAGYSPYSHGESKTDNMKDDKPEPEVVLFPDIKGLAIQGHPEMAYPAESPWEHSFIGYCREQLDKLMAM
jgi:hypothetical protein